MTKASDVPCPRYHSSEFYKYGFDYYDNQKYQCQVCKIQFPPASLAKQNKYLNPGNYKYQPCPKCGKATFLHHDYNYYKNLKFSDKNCNHTFSEPKFKEIEPLPPKISLPGKFNFKGMRHSPNLILMALYQYRHLNYTTRKISQFLKAHYNFEVSHVSIAY